MVSLLSPKVNLKQSKPQKLWTHFKTIGTFLGKMGEFLSTFPDHTASSLFALSNKNRPHFPTLDVASRLLLWSWYLS